MDIQQLRTHFEQQIAALRNQLNYRCNSLEGLMHSLDQKLNLILDSLNGGASNLQSSASASLMMNGSSIVEENVHFTSPVSAASFASTSSTSVKESVPVVTPSDARLSAGQIKSSELAIPSRSSLSFEDHDYELAPSSSNNTMMRKTPPSMQSRAYFCKHCNKQYSASEMLQSHLQIIHKEGIEKFTGITGQMIRDARVFAQKRRHLSRGKKGGERAERCAFAWYLFRRLFTVQEMAESAMRNRSHYVSYDPAKFSAMLDAVMIEFNVSAVDRFTLYNEIVPTINMNKRTMAKRYFDKQLRRQEVLATSQSEGLGDSFEQNDSAESGNVIFLLDQTESPTDSTGDDEIQPAISASFSIKTEDNDFMYD